MLLRQSNTVRMSLEWQLLLAYQYLFWSTSEAVVNSTFLSFAMQAGLTYGIANPSQKLLMNTGFASTFYLVKKELLKDI